MKYHQLLEDFIKKCLLRFFRKIVRLGNSKIQQRMLSIWIPIPRKSRAPQKTLRYIFINTLKTALPDIVLSKDALLKEWATIAKDEAKWKVLVTLLFLRRCGEIKTGWLFMTATAKSQNAREKSVHST